MSFSYGFRKRQSAEFRQGMEFPGLMRGSWPRPTQLYGASIAASVGDENLRPLHLPSARDFPIPGGLTSEIRPKVELYPSAVESVENLVTLSGAKGLA